MDSMQKLDAEQMLEDLLLRKQPEPDWSDLAMLGAKLDADIAMHKAKADLEIARLQCEVQ
jgi:hypothetical protein